MPTERTATREPLTVASGELNGNMYIYVIIISHTFVASLNRGMRKMFFKPLIFTNIVIVDKLYMLTKTFDIIILKNKYYYKCNFLMIFFFEKMLQDSFRTRTTTRISLSIDYYLKFLLRIKYKGIVNKKYNKHIGFKFMVL
ncbi:hypothetical protein ACJX0J_011432 [Zea mays]